MAPRRPALWTIGYQGKDQAAFIDVLHTAGVKRVVDVRDLTRSRLKGFSKTQLAEGLHAAGIDYLHVRALGAPAAIRKPYLAGGAFDTFRKRYLAHLAQQAAALDDLEAAARERPTAIMCMEADVTACHRQFVAEAMAGRAFRVHHL